MSNKLGRFKILDDANTIFFERELEHVKAKSYDVEYPDLLARQVIPVSFEADPGADTIAYEQYDMVGIAKVISNYATDLPRVDLKGTKFTANVRSLGDSFGYSLQDIRAARMAGKGLEQRKANAAKRSILMTEDDIAFNGDADHGLQGLLSNANITDVAIPADGTGSVATWSAKTPAQIVRDVSLLVESIRTLTKGVHSPNTLLLPEAQHTLISNTQMTGVNLTILQFILQNSPFIKTIIPVYKLKGAGVGNTDMMIAYDRSPDCLTLEIPQDFEQLPVQEQGLEFVTNCHSRCGGVLIYYPLSLAKGDAI